MKKLYALLILFALTLTIVGQSKLGGTAKIGGTTKVGVSTVVCASFPCTSILDNFNRANEGPPPSTNWTTGIDGGANGFKVDTNEAEVNGDPSSGYWNVQNFGPNVEVYVTLGVATQASRVHWRIQQEGTAGWDGYTLLAYTDNNFYVYRVDNGVQTQLGAAIAQTFSSGDSFGISHVGSTITVYYCASGAGCGVSGAGWTNKGTRTDNTYSSAGKIGMSMFDSSTTTALDNFGGGTL